MTRQPCSRDQRMNKLWKWFSGKRNECSVTYSRFGVPGDVLDDRPLPSTICIAQFDDNDPKFIFFKLCHAQRAAVTVAGFGMSFVILIFMSSFFEFDWYSHKTGIDIMALAFLFLYLGIGLFVHYQVIAGVKKQASHYLLPFIASYIVVIDGEAIFIFIHMLHIQSPSFGYSFNAGLNVIYLFSITIMLIAILFQGFMLKAVCQCRYYLSCKEIHLTALKVAESSRTKYPGIHVVFTSPVLNSNYQVNTVNGSRVVDGATIEQRINSTW
uniref:MARVEL domain-containing protein n=1 Tax=Elaeophora elaphi TaxID=1147741 RepID=A0A0R3S2H2_9BILA